MEQDSNTQQTVLSSPTQNFSSNFSTSFTSPKLSQSDPFEATSELTMQNIDYQKEKEMETNAPDEAYIAREEVCKKMMKLMQHFLSPTKQKTPQTHHSSLPFSTPLRNNPSFSVILTPHKPTKTLLPTQEINSASVENRKVICENEKDEKIEENFNEKSDSDNDSSDYDLDFLDSSSESEENELEEDIIEEKAHSSIEEKQDEKELELKMKLLDTDVCNDSAKKRNKYLIERADVLSAMITSDNTHHNNSSDSSPPPSSSSSSASSSSSSFSTSSSSTATTSTSQSQQLYASHEFPTKMDAALKRVGKEGVKQYMKIRTLWSKATQKKHGWVERLLVKFAEVVEEKPWPLSPDLARAFVLFCGKECKYPLSSIGYIIVPSLKRINIERRGKKLNKKTYVAMREAVRCLRFARNVEKNIMIREPRLG